MKVWIKHTVPLILILLAACLSVALRPTIIVADELPPISLRAMIPAEFNDWREQLNVTAQIIDPQQKDTLDRIYSETLTRTYGNRQGYRIMLSIAYGKNQSKALELHAPETCYPAQGFSLLSKQKTALDLAGRFIATTRLATNLGQRFEPVTYWTVVGDSITTSAIDKRLVEMRYAMRGRIPDGMLVRVSSIDKDTNNAHTIQDQFARELIQSIAPEYRGRIAGLLKSP